MRVALEKKKALMTQLKRAELWFHCRPDAEDQVRVGEEKEAGSRGHGLSEGTFADSQPASSVSPSAAATVAAEASVRPHSDTKKTPTFVGLGEGGGWRSPGGTVRPRLKAAAVTLASPRLDPHDDSIPRSSDALLASNAALREESRHIQELIDLEVSRRARAEQREAELADQTARLRQDIQLLIHQHAQTETQAIQTQERHRDAQANVQLLRTQLAQRSEQTASLQSDAAKAAHEADQLELLYEQLQAELDQNVLREARLLVAGAHMGGVHQPVQEPQSNKQPAFRTPKKPTKPIKGTDRIDEA
jgi:hypothetical protein